jgi:hypothetical protein
VLKIRNFVKGEELPSPLAAGFEKGNQPEWIWLAERQGKIVAILVAAPAHIVAILLRLASTDDAEPMDVRILLVNAISEIKKRGFEGYVTWLSPETGVEKKLYDIIMAGGGIQLPQPMFFCVGRF